MIGSTEHEHHARGTIAEVVVAERNARAAVERAGQSERRLADVERRLQRLEVLCVQMQEENRALTTKVAVLAGAG